METPIWVLRRAQNRAGAVLLPMLLLVCSAVLLALPGASARAASLNLRQPLSAGVAHTRPGIPSAAASPQAVAGELAQVTGLTPSQVAAANVCPTPSPGTAQCLAQAVVLRSTHARVHPHVHARATFTQVFPRHRSGQAGASGATTGTPATGATAPPTASTPAYLQQAYDLTYLSQTAGGSDTVAIVDAYDDPNAESDLAHFRSNYGLPACTTGNGCFKKVNENGQASPLPSGDLGWEEEESLDLDAVSSLCPNCHIILVEANSNFNSDLYAAIATAESLGANQISNSWGGTSSVPFGASSYPGADRDRVHRRPRLSRRRARQLPGGDARRHRGRRDQPVGRHHEHEPARLRRIRVVAQRRLGRRLGLRSERAQAVVSGRHRMHRDARGRTCPPTPTRTPA